MKSIGNGETMLSLVQEETFDLIVSDLVMPKVDGFQVLQILKDNNIKIPVIILTNLSQPEDETRVKALGAKDLFIKSNTPLSKIVEHIKATIQK